MVVLGEQMVLTWFWQHDDVRTIPSLGEVSQSQHGIDDPCQAYNAFPVEFLELFQLCLYDQRPLLMWVMGLSCGPLAGSSDSVCDLVFNFFSDCTLIQNCR